MAKSKAADDLPRTFVCFSLRMAPKEIARYRAKARALGMSLNSFLRTGAEMAAQIADADVLRIAAKRAAEGQPGE